MIPILFQDKSLAVCLKPPGLLSQDGPGDTLPSLLRRQLEGEVFPVHRLDREAGGVMVYARTSRAAAALSLGPVVLPKRTRDGVTVAIAERRADALV